MNDQNKTSYNPNNIALEDHVLTPDGLALVLDIDEEARAVRVIHNSVYAGPNTKEMDLTVEYCITQVEKVQEWVIIYEDKFAKPGAMPRVYTIRETTESQLPQLLSSLKAKLHEEYLETCKTWTPEAWQKQFNAPLRDTSDTPQAVTIEQWYKMEREHLLGNAELHMETYREFMDALEVLPPQKWTNREGFETFLMSEYWTGSYTTQHACVTHQGKHICACRLVDARDKSTWITREQVMAAHEAGEEPEIGFSEVQIDKALKRFREDGKGLNWACELGFEEEYNRFLLAACVETVRYGGEKQIERVNEIDILPLLERDQINELFWTIYAYKKDGECAAIADFHTKEEAERVFVELCRNLADPYNF
jgi:hypothetical protein